MKKLILLLAACALIAMGCKGGTQRSASDSSTSAVSEAAASAQGSGLVGEAFTFDELFRIFSIFGSNIMTEKFAPQSVKDGIKDELKSFHEGFSEFNGTCNMLEHSLFDGDCYDTFRMACYRYPADGHVLVLLLEEGGCDVSSVKYLRSYEYNPETNDAREIELPFNPAVNPADFDDILRMAGADIPSLRNAIMAGLYQYGFNPNYVAVVLNDPSDFDEAVYHGALQVLYRWNGSEFVRDEDYVYPCIHAEGFANIKLGENPDLNIINSSRPYKATYSSGGDLWLIDRDGKNLLEIQMDGGKVYSVEVRSPKYCVSPETLDYGKGKLRVGERINDVIDLQTEGLTVWMLMDGTVVLEQESRNSVIAFYAGQNALEGGPAQPDDRIRIEKPVFKADARIESILVRRK